MTRPILPLQNGGLRGHVAAALFRIKWRAIDVVLSPAIALVVALITDKRNLLAEWALRCVALGSYAYMIAGLIIAWIDQSRPYGLLLLVVTETFTLLLILLAKHATRRDSGPLLMLAVTYTSGFFLFLDSAGTSQFIPDSVAASIQGVGLGLTILAKLTIGRSFGILPAARSLTVQGPYRVVRHPMYLGYIASNLAFLLAHYSMRNGLLMTALFLVQVLRILREEDVLSRSGLACQYSHYRHRVRYRLIPLVF